MAKKLSLRPAQKTEEQELQEFISAASQPNVSEVGEAKPWDDPRVRDDVLKMVSLRLQERHVMQLQFLSEQTGRSQQEILRRLVVPYLESEVLKY